MKKNISGADRLVRIIIGLIFVVVAYIYSISWLYILAAISIVTGVVGYCGLYSLINKLFKKK